jgi:hypothetical protein
MGGRVTQFIKLCLYVRKWHILKTLLFTYDLYLFCHNHLHLSRSVFPNRAGQWWLSIEDQKRHRPILGRWRSDHGSTQFRYLLKADTLIVAINGAIRTFLMTGHLQTDVLKTALGWFLLPSL